MQLFIPSSGHTGANVNKVQTHLASVRDKSFAGIDRFESSSKKVLDVGCFFCSAMNAFQ